MLLDGEDFILQVHRVFTRILSGTALGVPLNNGEILT
jgi:hypothetical protein